MSEPALARSERDTQATPAVARADPVAGQRTNTGRWAVTDVIAEDGTAPPPGGTTRGAFLAMLGRDLETMVDEELAGTGMTGAGCPIIEGMLERYRAAPLDRWQAFLVHWVPPVTGRTPDDLRAAVVARARTGIRTWRSSGDGSVMLPADPAGLLGSAARAVGLPNPVPADPVTNLLEALLRLGPGEPLTASQRQRLGTALDANLSTVQVHRSDTLPGLAVTAGEHVVLGAHAPATGTLAAEALLAHEVAHTVQQRSAPATDAAGAERDADDAAASAIAGGRAPRLAGTGLRLASCGGSSGGILGGSRDVERLTGEQIPAVPGRQAAPAIGALPAFTAPARPAPGLGERLESTDPAVRAAALEELSRASGPDGWRAAVLASASPLPEVATAAEQLVVRWLARPDFLAWLAALPAQGSGQLGDLAVGLLARAGRGGQVDLDGYRGLLRQQLQLLRAYRGELATARTSASTGPDTSFGDLEAGLATTDAIQLAQVGRRISRLLDRFTLIRAEVARADSLAATDGLSGPMGGLVRAHRQAMLDAAVTIGSDERDTAFESALAGMRRFTVDTTRQTVTELGTHVDEARNDLRTILQPAVGFAPVPRLTALVPPLIAELDRLTARIAAWQPAVDQHPIAVLEDLARIQPTLRSLLARVRLARSAVASERAARELESQLVYTPPPPTPSMSGGEGQFVDPMQGVGQGLMDQRDKDAIVADLRTHRDNFTLLAERYESNPEVVEQLEAAGAESAQQTGRRMQIWMTSQAARYQADLVTAEIQLAVAILIVSAWTGGLAGEAAAGGLEMLGVGELIGGRSLIWVGSVIAEGSAFYTTQRGLDWAVHGGQGPVFPTTWRRDLLLSIGAVGALRAVGGLFEALAGARPPSTGLSAGRFAASYATLLAYGNIIEPLARGEPIPGLGTARFWTSAGETLLMMGAVHVGLAAMRPLTLRITEPLLRARISAHNVRAERIGAELQANFQGEPDPARTRSLVRRSRAMLQERIGLLREIAARDPSQLTQAEFAELSALLQTQIRQADSTLLLDAFRVRPLGSGQNVFGYEGTFEMVRSHFLQRGFTVVSADPASGLLRLHDPSGQEIAFIRMHAGATGADPLRMPPEADLTISRGPNEVERRATEAYDTIRTLTDDVLQIAQNTGVPAHVIEAVRQHLFFRLHTIAVAPGRANVQRFDPMYSLARLWLRAYEGVLTDTEVAEFRRLMAHEYVEQGLMLAGMPYRSAHPGGWRGDVTQPGREHFGAHDVAPSEHRADPYAFRQQLGLDPAGQPVPQTGEVWDYDAALRGAFESLAGRTGGPYRVVADPTAQYGYRIEARDPAELGTLATRRGITPTSGADPAWNSLRTQLIGRGLTAQEAQDLVALLDAARQTPTGASPVAALTADQLRQLIPLDAPGLGRVLGLDAALLPEALALCTMPGDMLGGRSLDALLQRMGRPWVEAMVGQPAGTPNRDLLGEMGRDALAAAQRPLPTNYWAESHSQRQLENVLDRPGSGFQRYTPPPTAQNPTPGPLSEPGFRGGTPLDRGRLDLAPGARRGATFPDVYGTDVASGQRAAMELKTPRLGETVFSYFRNPQTEQWIIDQHAGRIMHLPQGTPSYLVVDIRQTGQTIPEGLADLSRVLRNYARMGDARQLWAGVRFITGTRTTAVLSNVYTIP
ncbi:eCIS core domain-containing protein [Actinopolymorpha singaporensis]